ncbi:Class I SAM-dependent methyltransferase [Rhodovastum atsumiense]|uniref:Class I SAM-dependent methyltransferase n=1 Tax=Rhodovastum atsumiense TaxID=504468 RepID=A0A5M6J3D9_9PROT|nr:class I SAM-dependent methyltransferase [Rhodovastum atsumiense]KAA5614739.1 class I SAM-dependent methyltransferase [Rhodovastum atsumiense]CAH2599721.1 Class I SAM-dependent methyltransferase [Rhodovastum atsumiense]
MTAHFTPEWLALREPLDAAARSPLLAARLAASLPARPRLLDLGAGTGALFRWLAPMLGRAQAWTLVDDEADRIEAAFDAIEAWADAREWTVTRPGRALLVHTPRGAWRVEALIGDLADLPALPFTRVDAVVCSALLDRASRGWIERLASLLRTPLLACLMARGPMSFLPLHPADAVLRAGLWRAQAQDSGLGPALGARAGMTLWRVLSARGFAVTSAPTDWHVPRTAPATLRAVVEACAEDAAAWQPIRSDAIEAWRRARIRQALAARLAICSGHRDSLALPPR